MSVVRTSMLLVALALVATATGSARAQDVSSEPARVATEASSEPPPSAPAIDAEQRVAVVLLPRGDALPEMTDSLTELLIAALAARGATEIVGKEEFQAALGRDDAGTLACIESDACLGRMGRELRVHELVAGTLHLQSPTVQGNGREHFRFELYRLDVESGTARGRVAREIDGLEALIAALAASVDELYVERVDPGAIVLETTPDAVSVTLDEAPVDAGDDGVFRRGFLVPGRHQLLVRAAGYQGLARPITIEPGTTLMLSVELEPRAESLTISTTTWLLGGSAAAALLAGLASGISSQSTTDTAVMRESQSFYDARQTEAVVANVLFAVGGAALVGTIVSLVLDVDASSRDVAARAMRGELARW